MLFRHRHRHRVRLNRMSVPGVNNPLFTAGQGDTLRLIAYLIMAVALMVTDYHSGYLERARAWLGAAAVPMYRIAQAPAVGLRWLYAAGGERVALKRENDALRTELLLAQARLNAAWFEAERNRLASGLAEAGRRHQLTGRMVEVFDIDIDPSRQRLLLDAGSLADVRIGQPVIDAFGLVGQVVATTTATATVMMLVDPLHAVPVTNTRTGQRAIARGIGRDDRLQLSTLPINSDIQPGDELVSSGLGGRFPAGFPVAVVREFEIDASGSFAQAWAEPVARLRQSTQLLLLDEQAVAAAGRLGPGDGIGPPVPDGDVQADDGDQDGAVPPEPGEPTTVPTMTEPPP